MMSLSFLKILLRWVASENNRPRNILSRQSLLINHETLYIFEKRHGDIKELTYSIIVL